MLLLLSVLVLFAKDPIKTDVLQGPKSNSLGEIVSTPCAVLIVPTKETIDSLKQTMKEEDFHVLADDSQWYVAQARTFLDSMKVSIIERESEGRVRFRLSDGKIIDYDLSGLSWGLLFFNGKTTPVKASLADPYAEFDRHMLGKE